LRTITANATTLSDVLADADLKSSKYLQRFEDDKGDLRLHDGIAPSASHLDYSIDTSSKNEDAGCCNSNQSALESEGPSHLYRLRVETVSMSPSREEKVGC
jgi:hypothetical protein